MGEIASTKICAHCGIEKSLSEYHRRSYTKCGVVSDCKACRKILAHEMHLKHKDYRNAINAKWKKENAEKHRAINKAWKENNRERTRQTNRALYIRTQEYRRAHYREYYQENKEHICQKNDKWKKDHPERVRELQRITGQRIRSTVYGRLNAAMGSEIWRVLKRAKQGKKWQILVGYTTLDLKSHLEKLFQPGMTWDNYGEWEIDHVIPKSRLKYNSPEDANFRICWGLKNLQPLWKPHNRRKYNRLDEDLAEALYG